MFNSLASKILPLQPISPELPSEIKSMDEAEVIQWQGKFQLCSDRLNAVLKDCSNYATYWSAFFENQLTMIRSNIEQQRPKEDQPESEGYEDLLGFEKLMLDTKQASNKKLTDFGKKIESRIKDMKIYIESMNKSCRKRKDKKLEIDKHEYYYQLYKNKEDLSMKDENALELTLNEKSELTNLETQLRRSRKELIIIETQMVENFPSAMSMFIEFMDNLSLAISYDIQEIYDYVYDNLNKFYETNPKFIKIFAQIKDSWTFDLSSIKKSLNNSEVFSQRPKSITETLMGSTSNNSINHYKSSPLSNSSTPSLQPKLNSSGMKSLNLNNKAGVRRSITISHRRTNSKNLDIKSMVVDASNNKDNNGAGLGIHIPDSKMINTKRFSGRSFSSASLEQHSREDDARSFVSSQSSLSEDDTLMAGESFHDTTLKKISSNSPSVSPRPTSKRSSLILSDSPSTNNNTPILTNSRMSLLVGNNRYSGIYNKQRFKNQNYLSPSNYIINNNNSNSNLINECPITCDFKIHDYKLMRQAKLNKSYSRSLYLNHSIIYEQNNKQYDYKELLKRSKEGKKINNFENEELIKVKAIANYFDNNFGKLSFTKDDSIFIVSKKSSNENFWIGKSEDGRIGEFPSNLVI